MNLKQLIRSNNQIRFEVYQTLGPGTIHFENLYMSFACEPPLSARECVKVARGMCKQSHRIHPHIQTLTGKKVV